ncbi:MAG: hypothetical protein CMB43_00210 [Euryarchaeota archaeon]|nr:hypothetical protein [Euryarchaeota archaeon]
MLGIIMAGGQGTRLLPLTENKPKPLVNILGKPVIDYVKDALVNANVSEIIVTTGYQGDSLVELVNQWNNNLAIECSVNQENSPMGTAGSVKLLQSKLTEAFFVASGDAVISSNLKLLHDAHRNSGAMVTMGLWEVNDPSQFGIVGLSSEHGGSIEGDLHEGFVVKFVEKPTPDAAFSRIINAGLYIVEPEVMELIPDGQKYDFSRQLFPHLLELGLPIYGFKLDGAWFDIGTPSELISAQNYLVKNTNSLPFMLPDGRYTADKGYLIGNATSKSPVIASVICSDSTIGKGSRINNSLIMSKTKIGDNCIIIESVIGEDVIIGDNTELTNCVIGDGVAIPADTILTDQRYSSSTFSHTE